MQTPPLIAGAAPGPPMASTSGPVSPLSRSQEFQSTSAPISPRTAPTKPSASANAATNATRTDESPFLTLSPAELRTFSTSLLKRLSDAPYPDVCGDLHLLRDVLSQCLHHPNYRNSQLFLQSSLHPSLDACLSRHALPISAECDAIQDVCQLALHIIVQHLMMAVGDEPDAGKGVAGCVAMHEFPHVCFQVPEPPVVPAAAVTSVGVPAGFSFGGYHGMGWTAPSVLTAVADAVQAGPSAAVAISSNAALSSTSSGDTITSTLSSSTAAAAVSSSSASTASSVLQPPSSPSPNTTVSAAEPDATTPSADAPSTMSALPAAAICTTPQPSASDTSTHATSLSAPASTPASPAVKPTMASVSGLSTPSSSSSSPGLALSRALTPSTSLLHAKTAAPICAYTSFLPTLQALHPIPPNRQSSPDFAPHLDVPLMDCLDLLFSTEHEYYRQCTPEYPCPRAVNDVELTGPYCEWRDALHTGEWVDVYLRGRWRCGQLLPAVDEQRVEVHFEGPSVHDNVWPGRREVVDRHSNLFAPLYSQTRPNLHPSQHWRFTLSTHSQLDALDTVQKWSAAPHNHTRPAHCLNQCIHPPCSLTVSLGLQCAGRYTARVLEVRGDHIRIAYDGWTNKYDETISLYSDRLAPHRAKAHGGKDSLGVQASVLDRGMDEALDVAWPTELVRWRGRDWSSWYWCENVQYFARLHGFQLLFYRIYIRHLCPLSIASLRRIASAVASCTYIFTRQLAYDYLPTFHFLVFATLLDLTDVELRQLSKELLEDVVKAVQRLLTRFCNTRQMQAYIDDFQLACAVKRLRCSVVERRVNGMHWLQDYISSLKRFPSLASLSNVGSTTTWLTPQQMIVYLEQHGVLQTALSLSTSHHELMKRSIDIFKLLATENALDTRHLDLIWHALTSAMRRDDETQLQTLYKLLDDLAWQLSSQHILYLFSLVESIPLSEYQLATLELIKELTRWANAKTGGAAAKRAMELLWSCMQEGRGVSQDIAKAALGRIEEIIKTRSHRIEYLEQYGAMLQSQTNSLTCLHLLTQLIDTFPDAITALEDKTKSNVIAYLNDQYRVVDSFVADLCAFKQHSVQLLQAQHVQPSAINNTVISSFTSYLSHIRERLNFLHYLLSHAPGIVSLTQQHMDVLWQQLYVNSLTVAEKEQLFRFLRLCVARHNKGALSDALSMHVFERLLLPSLQSPQSLTVSHYTAFESFFFHINFIHRKVNGTSADDVVVTSDDFSLYGLDTLWRIAFECSTPQVSSKAIQLLNTLHENGSEDTTNVRLVREKFIDSCITSLAGYVREEDWVRGRRCMGLLHALLDANDRKGVGRARSHACSTRGRRLRLVVQNNIKVKQGQRKRVELIAHANDTLFALRQSIASTLSLLPDSFRLITAGKPLSPEQFPLLLHQLSIKDGQTLLVTKKQSNLQKADLLDGRQEPTPAFRQALSVIFHRFAGGKDERGALLTGSDFATYILACGAGEQSAGEDRIRTIFEKHGEKLTMQSMSQSQQQQSPNEEQEASREQTSSEMDKQLAPSKMSAGGGVKEEEHKEQTEPIEEAVLTKEKIQRHRSVIGAEVPPAAPAEEQSEEDSDKENVNSNQPAHHQPRTADPNTPPPRRQSQQSSPPLLPPNPAPTAVTRVELPSLPPVVVSHPSSSHTIEFANDDVDDDELMDDDEEDEEDEQWDSEAEQDMATDMRREARDERFERALSFMSPSEVLPPHLVQPNPPITDQAIHELSARVDQVTVYEFSDDGGAGIAGWFRTLNELEHSESAHLPVEQQGAAFGGLVEFVWEFFQCAVVQKYTGPRSSPKLHEWQWWLQRLVQARDEPVQRPVATTFTLDALIDFVQLAEASKRKWDCIIAGTLQPRPASSLSLPLSVSPSVSPLPASPVLNPASSASPSPTTPPSPPPVLILRLSGFVDFYRDACLDRVEAVWNDLTCHGFRHDLKREDGYLSAGEDGQSNVDGGERTALTEEEKEAALPRSIFAQHLNYYQLLFHILTLSEQRLMKPATAEPLQQKYQHIGSNEDDMQGLAGSVWNLLQRLSSQPSLVHQLMHLQPPVALDSLLSPQSLYCLLYTLQVLDALCEPLDDDDDKLIRAHLQQQRDAWCDAFLNAGGFVHLMHLFDAHPALTREAMTGALLSLRQKCAALLFRLLYHLILSAMRVQMPSLGCVDRVRSVESEAAMDERDREEEKRWIAQEKEREEKEEESQPPALFTPFTHGPLQEHEMEAKREEKKEMEEKQKEESSKVVVETSKQRVSVSVDDDDSDSEEDTFLSRSLSSSSQPLLLGCHMSTAQSTAIVSSLQLVPHLYRFYHLVHDVAQHPVISIDDLAVVEPALNLLLHLILFATTQLLPVYRNLLLSRADLFFDILLCSSSGSPPLRRLFCQCQYQLAIHATGEVGESAGTGLKVWLLRYLLDHFPIQAVGIERAVECDEYFKLLSALIVEQINDESAAGCVDNGSGGSKDESVIAPATAPLSPSGSAYSDTSSASSSSSSSSASVTLSTAQSIGLSVNGSGWLLPVSTLFGDMCWRLLLYGPMEYEQPSGTIAQDKVLCGILSLLRLLVEQRQDLKHLASHPLQDLKTHPTAATIHSSLSTDSDPATGASQSAHSLISLLFNVYLFNLPPKARHPDTRGQALSLLTTVCSLPVNNAILFALLGRQHLSLTHLTTFDFNVEKLVRSPYGHVGLRNLGSTCFDLRTQVVVDAGDGRGPRWIGGVEVWRLWQDENARPLMRIASLQTWHDAEIAAGEPCGTRDQLVYSQLKDVVEPFVYDKHYDVDEHPVHLRASRSTDADLLLTPDHMVWAAPLLSNCTDSRSIGMYRRVRADEVATQAVLGISWQLKLTAPVPSDKDYSFQLPPLSEFLKLSVLLPNVQASLSSLCPSSEERSVLDGLLLTGAAMDAWLAFVGFHIAARGCITGDGALRYDNRPPPVFAHCIASRLPSCLSAALLDVGTVDICTAAAPLVVCLAMAGLCNPESSGLPAWLWQLSARQLRVLLVGMTHAQQHDNKAADDVVCEWCQCKHPMVYSLSTSSRQRADDVQLLAMHAGLTSSITFTPFAAYTITSTDSAPHTVVASSSSSSLTATKSPGCTVALDQRPSIRLRRFWCVTTAADSHVVLVRRRRSGPNGVRSYHTALVGQCYMNSLLQQLYMMPSFRYGVWLSALDSPIAREEREAEKLQQLPSEEQPEVSPPTKEQKALEHSDDDLLYQLQVMFTYLSQSTKQYYDTLPFCFAYKDERGQPINVRIQQDAQEFFNVLLDRLEKRLMSIPYPPSLTPLSHLIQSSFGGTLVNQLLCHACHNIRSSPEPFYSLSLQVKNKSTLSDSLDAYVLGEELSDFNCSECKQRVNITKRVCLGGLPPVVIMHLKRFELNYETFQHEKLNNRFVFPLDVNLEPYTIEGLARIEKEASKQQLPVAANGVPLDAVHSGANGDQSANGTDVPSSQQPHSASDEVTEDIKPAGYYDYELVGILIHTGNSTSGHYYSFVKDRCTPQHNQMPVTTTGTSSTAATPVWLEFNDNQIRPFDLSMLDEAAYGGEQEVTERGTWGNDIVTQQDKVKNAYMLIYERKQPVPRQTPSHPQPATNGHSHSATPAQSAAGNVQKTKDNAEWLRPELLSTPLTRIIPPSMCAAVERDNQQFQFDRQVFNESYFNFLIHFMRSARPSSNATPLTLAELSLVHSGGVEAVSGVVAVEVLYALRLCQLMTVFAFDCLVRCADNKCFVEYSRELQLLYEGSIAACQWLLDWLASRAATLGELLLACRDEHVRDGVKCVIVTALRKLSLLESNPTLLDTVEDEVDSNSATPSAAASPVGSGPSSPNAKKVRVHHFTSLSSHYIVAHVSQLAEAAKHWMRFTQYFELLYQFALIGSAQCYFLVAHGCIARLCDMYLGDVSPLNYSKRKRASIGNVMVAPNWPVVLELVAHLVRSCRTDQSPRCLPSTIAPADCDALPASPPAESELTPPLSPSSGLPGPVCLAPAAVCPHHSPYTIGDGHSGLHLNSDDEKVIRCPFLYQYALSQNVAVQSISLLACHWCWEDMAYSDAIYDMLLSSFGKLDHALNERPYLDMLLHITAISDSLTQQRFVRLTRGNGHNSKGLLALLLHIRHTQPRKTWAGVTLLLALARQVPNFALHLGETRNDWVWMDVWMKDHASRGKPKGILTGPVAAVSQPDEDREAVWQQYETMVRAFGHKLELPVLHAPVGVSGMPSIGGGAVGHHQLSRRLSAEDGSAGSEQTSPAGMHGRHRRASHIDTTTTLVHVANNPQIVKQQRRPMNRTAESAPQHHRVAGQRSAEVPKLVTGQPNLARRFVHASVARTHRESEDDMDSDESDDDGGFRSRSNDVPGSFTNSRRQQLHQPAQQADDDDIYETAERDRTAATSLQGLAADEDDDDGDATYQQQDATALGDDDNSNDNDDDDELTATAAVITTSNSRHRRNEPYHLSPSSPAVQRTNLSFEAGSARVAANNVGSKRRAPTTPVGVGGSGRLKGKAAPNSPASVGRSRGDGGWSVRRDSSDGGSGSGSGGGNGGGGGGAQIACAACTFLNPSHARVCDICENPLS